MRFYVVFIILPIYRQNTRTYEQFLAEAYSEPFQISKVMYFAKIVDS